MSDDLVNQLTLNCLISKHQLQKLNKKNKNAMDEQKRKEIKEYEVRIQKLFTELLVCSAPDDLLLEVKSAFDHFIESSISYFKIHDNLTNDGIIQDDIDFERDERAIERGDYVERDERRVVEEGDGEDEEEEEEEDEEDEEEEEKDKAQVKRKATSNWFQTVKQTNKQHTIFPRNPQK
jgi:hypothetical protein